MKTIAMLIMMIVGSVIAQDEQPIIPCKMCIVPYLLGKSYADAVIKWHDAGFESPVFPNRWCIDQQHCTLVVVEQGTPAGTVECFYAPVGVIMQ